MAEYYTKGVIEVKQRLISVATMIMMLLPFCGCHKSPGTDLISAMPIATENINSTTSSSTNTETNAIASSSASNMNPTAMPTSTDNACVNSFLMSFEYLLDTEDCVLYTKDGAVHKLDKQTREDKVIGKPNLDVMTYFYGMDNNIYYLTRENDNEKQHLHLGNDILIRDIDDYFYSNQDSIFYKYNNMLYEYNVHIGKSRSTNFDLSSISEYHIIPQTNTMLFSYINQNGEYTYNFVNGDINKFYYDKDSYWLTDDGQYLYREAISTYKNEYTVLGLDLCSIGSFYIDWGLGLSNIVVHDNTAYTLFRDAMNSTLYIYVVDLNTSEILGSHCIYQSALSDNGFSYDCRYYKNKYYIYVHDSDEEKYFDEDAEQRIFSVTPKMYEFDFNSGTITKLWERPKQSFDDFWSPVFEVADNQFWFYINANTAVYTGPYTFWFTAPLE